MARREKTPELDAAEAEELTVRRLAERARAARARAEDRAHVDAMSRYGRPWEQLFRSKKRGPSGGGGKSA